MIKKLLFTGVLLLSFMLSSSSESFAQSKSKKQVKSSKEIAAQTQQTSKSQNRVDAENFKWEYFKHTLINDGEFVSVHNSSKEITPKTDSEKLNLSLMNKMEKTHIREFNDINFINSLSDAGFEFISVIPDVNDSKLTHYYFRRKVLILE